MSYVLIYEAFFHHEDSKILRNTRFLIIFLGATGRLGGLVVGTAFNIIYVAGYKYIANSPRRARNLLVTLFMLRAPKDQLCCHLD